MYLQVWRTMAANHGLITTAQARDCGLTTTHIGMLVRTGKLVVVRRGIYTDGETWEALDEDRGRHRLRTRAATMRMTRAFVASHDSSAHEHGLEILNPPDPHVHITRPGSTNAWTEYGVKHHLARYRAGAGGARSTGSTSSISPAPRSTSLGSTASPTARSPAMPPCAWAYHGRRSRTPARS